MEVRQLDINNVFIHEILSDDIYKAELLGVSRDSSSSQPLVFKLQKLYMG